MLIPNSVFCFSLSLPDPKQPNTTQKNLNGFRWRRGNSYPESKIPQIQAQVQLTLCSSQSHRLSMFLLSWHVQRSVRHGWWWPSRPHSRKQRQHRTLHHLRCLRSPRWWYLQHPRTPSHPCRRLLHLYPLRWLFPLLQPSQAPSFRHCCWCSIGCWSWSFVGWSRRYHDILPSCSS